MNEKKTKNHEKPVRIIFYLQSVRLQIRKKMESQSTQKKNSERTKSRRVHLVLLLPSALSMYE